VNVAIEMGGGQLTPTKKLGRVAVIDVVEVSCAQHAAAPVAPLRIQGSAYNYRPANRRSMSKRANNQTRAISSDASALPRHSPVQAQRRRHGGKGGPLRDDEVVTRSQGEHVQHRVERVRVAGCSHHGRSEHAPAQRRSMQLDLQPLRALRVIRRDVEGHAGMAAGKGGSSSHKHAELRFKKILRSYCNPAHVDAYGERLRGSTVRAWCADGAHGGVDGSSQLRGRRQQKVEEVEVHGAAVEVAADIAAALAVTLRAHNQRYQQRRAFSHAC